MKKLLIFLLLIEGLFATGPSMATIELTPIATNEDATVLFQTYRNISPGGGYGAKNEAYGWLVVSAVYDIWDERITLKGDNNDPKSREKLEAYEKGKVNLAHPDKVLKNMMEKYYFDKDSKLVSEKYSVLELKPKQSCYKGKCIERVLTQKTIENHTSTNIVESIRGYKFFFKGVALFSNGIEYENEEGEGEVVYGGEFNNFENLWNGDKNYDLGYELMSIDALTLFDPYIFREPSNAKKVEVERVVKDIFTLLKNKKWEKFNKNYIHPRYGYFSLYAMAASAFPQHYSKIRELPSVRRSSQEPNYLDNFSSVPKVISWKSVYITDDDCNWNLEGTFIQDFPYNSIVKVMNDNYARKYFKNEEIEQMKFLDKDVLVVTDTEHDIIFHLKKIEGRWYVVLFDRIYTNRDA